MPGATIDMNKATSMFVEFLESNDVERPHSNKSVKEIIQKHIPDIEFIPAKQQNRPHKLMLPANTWHDDKSKQEKIDTVLETAEILRKQLLNSRKWTFTGTFTDYKDDQLINSFFQHIVSGPYQVTNSSKLK